MPPRDETGHTSRNRFADLLTSRLLNQPNFGDCATAAVAPGAGLLGPVQGESAGTGSRGRQVEFETFECSVQERMNFGRLCPMVCDQANLRCTAFAPVNNADFVRRRGIEQNVTQLQWMI